MTATTHPITTPVPVSTTGAGATRRLLACGLVAGPLYVAVSLGQALTRDGFVLYRHAWSQLAAGERGWVQQANLALTGLLLAAFAHGLRRRAPAGAVHRVANLVTMFGAGMVAAAFFTADPALGFPAGTPADYRGISGHGLGHMISASLGFLAVTAATVVAARHFARQHDRRWALWSVAAGAVFIGSFVAVSATGSAPAVIAFTVGVVVIFAWIATLAVRARRTR